MKLKYTYLFFIAIGAFVLLKSNSTGVPANTTSCAGGSCHMPIPIGNTTMDSILFIDKTTGMPVNNWVAGQSYRIGFIGKFVGPQIMPKFGFQFNNGGKGNFSGIPSGTSIVNATGVSYWGHTTRRDTFSTIVNSMPIPSISIFVDTATWTAPATGSGAVTFSGIINAVDNSSTSAGDKPGTMYSRTITEATSTVASVNVLTSGMPNPAICAGQRKNFLANPTNGGSAPTYQWYINSTPVGTNSDTFSSTTLADNDTVYVIMTSNLAGVTGSPATSNKVKITVNPIFNNIVTITSNKTNVCAGDTAIYTATPPAGATGVNYRWYVKNVLVQGPNPTSTFTKIGFAAGDTIWCSLQVSNGCPVPGRDTSNYISMTVNSSPIVTKPSNKTLCAGDTSKTNTWTSSIGGTTFTWSNSDPSIGLAASGTGDSLPWFKSINNGGTNKNATITIRSFGAGCSGAPVSFTITVRPTARVTPPLAALTNFCHGISGNILMLTQPPFGTTVNWSINNTNVGIPASGTSNTISFTGNSTADSAIATITARATIGTCIGPDTTFNIYVYKPTVNQPMDVDTCEGTNIAIPDFVSNFPTATFNWTNTNTSIGLASVGNGNIFFPSDNPTSSPITSIVSVRSNYKNCPSALKTFNITIQAQAHTVATISSPDTLMCPGGSSVITASSINGGTAPSYEWYRNGSLISGTSDINTLTNIADNDNVFCIVTSNSTCTTNPIDTSNTLVIKTTTAIEPKIDISTISNTICKSDPVTFNSTISSGGTSPSYQWLLNGDTIPGATSDYYLTGSLNNNDQISCLMTSSLTCASPKTDTSNVFLMKVSTKIFPSLSLDKNKNKICSDDVVIFYPTYKDEGAAPKFQWYVNGIEMGSNPISFHYNITNSLDVIKFKLTAAEPCAIPKEQEVSISVDTVDQGPIVSVEPNKYIAFCEGDSFMVQALGGLPNYRFKWSTGDTTRTFISKKSQSFVLTVSEPGNRCTRKYGPLTTYANPIPAAPEITRNGSVLRSSPAANYQWQLDGFDIVGANFQTYTYSIYGIYTVKTVNNAGCANKSLAYEAKASSVNQNEEADITIYPNPSNDIFNITTPDKINLVSVYNLLGNLIYQDNKSENNKSISLENQAKGDYIILIQTDKSTHRSKLELR